MYWIFGVAGICLLICLPLFLYYKKALRYKLAAAYKTLGTLCAASLALIAALKLDPHYWICFAALVLHSAADYLLEFNFFFGAGVFLAGHIGYIIFFTILFPVSATHLILALGMLAIMAVFFWRWRKPIGKQLPLFTVYGVGLALMSACAIAGLTGHSLQGQLIAAGGALFYISDAFLLGRLLFSATRAMDWIIMITYYAAQLLIGASCLL